jgi:autotransporter-associated beta strand protein
VEEWNMSNSKSVRKVYAAATFAAATALASVHATSVWAASTGFNQAGAGPYDYNNSANWVGGNINGVWDPSLVLTAAQTVTFATSTPLGTGLYFGYNGSFGLTLDSANTTPETLTLGGDITVAPVGNQTVTIGNLADALNVDLGGVTRNFNVSSGKALSIYNAISDGSFNVQGGGTVNLYGVAGAAPSSAVSVNASTLAFASNAAGNVGTTRAASVDLAGAVLGVYGNTTTSSNDTISGSLTIDQSATGGTDFVTITSVTKSVELTVANIARANEGVAIFSGPNLGATPGNGVANIFATTAPTLVGGGGAAGSTTISIIPWAFGQTTAISNYGTAGNGNSFVTYGANGIRPLATSEYATAVGGSATDNVMLNANSASGSQVYTVTTPTTVNSLYLNGSGAYNVTVNNSGSGSITVTSGAVFLNNTKNNTINAPLNFGSAEGVIGYESGQLTYVNGPISGTGGLTLYQPLTTNFVNAATFGSSASTYTGDTRVMGAAIVSTGFLPSGTRTGNVYVDGSLQLNTSFTGAINGLFGAGSISYAHSTTASLSIGSNNQNGLFTGTISNSQGILNVAKIGSGTLALYGASTYTGTTTVSGGTLQADGARAFNTSGTLIASATGPNAVTIASGGTLAGNGGTGAVTVSNGGIITSGTGATPSDTPGTLNTGAQAWAAGGTLVSKISPSVSDELIMTGLSFGSNTAGNFAVNVFATTPTTLTSGQVIVLVDDKDTNTASNPFASGSVPAQLALSTPTDVSPASGDTLAYAVQQDLANGGYDLVLEDVAAAPEPTSLLLAATAIAPLALRRHSRRRSGPSHAR